MQTGLVVVWSRRAPPLRGESRPLWSEASVSERRAREPDRESGRLSGVAQATAITRKSLIYNAQMKRAGIPTWGYPRGYP